MIAEVHLRDNRTVFQLPSRNAIRRLLEANAGNDTTREQGFVVWNKQDEGVTLESFEPVRLTYLREPAIAFICEAQVPCEGVKKMAEERKQRWEERQAEAEAADALEPVGSA